ncbi:MAG TPA: hypothetical protein VIN56_07235 [Candidatus Dormibacteraeota bacterium]
MAWFTVRRLFLGAVLLAVVVPAVQPVADPDYFWHLEVGRWILAHGAIPTHDLFTSTVANHPFVAHEWGSEVIIALVTGALAFPGVSLYFAVITWLAFLGLLLAMRHVSYPIAGVMLVLGVVAGNPIWGPRTQMITFALVALLLLLLRRYRFTGDRRWLYPLPVIFVVWVNLHAGFTIGLVFLAITVVGEGLFRLFRKDESDGGQPAPMRSLLVVAVISALVVMVNPNTFQIYLYAAQTQFSPAQQKLIVEWFSPNFHMFEVRPFEAMLLLFPVLLTLSKRKPRVTDMLLLLTVTVLALQSVRHIALFVAAGVPVLAELAQAAWDTATGGRRILRDPRPGRALGLMNAAVLGLVAIAVLVVSVPHARSGPSSAAVRKDYPVAAVDSFKGDPPPGQMFNQYGWGGYLTYRLWPQRQVFIYGDAAVMGDSFLDEYQGIEVIKPDYRATLDRRHVDWVIDYSGNPLDVALEETGDWIPTYRDDQTVVLVRRSDATAGYLDRHPRV